QLLGSGAPVGLVRSGVGLQLLVGSDTGRTQRPAVAAPAFLHFRKAGSRSADEGDGAPPALEQMGGRFEAAALVVRGYRRAEPAVAAASPADEMRAAVHELLKLRTVFEIVAVTQE